MRGISRLSYGEFEIVGRSCPSVHTFVLKPALNATGQIKLITVASKQHVLHKKLKQNTVRVYVTEVIHPTK